MADRNGYIGRAPGDSAVIIARQSYAPTGIQTDFTFNATYTPGYLDAYLNGVRLVYPTDYSASDGNTVGLTTHAINGDTLELVAYKSFNLGSVEEAPGNFSVGNNLTVTGGTTLSGSLNVTGVTTLGAGTSVSYATTSFGVSGLTTGSNVTANYIVGAAITSTGPVEVTSTTESTSNTTGALIISGGVGIAKSLHVGGNISVGGTLTYEDVKNVDSVGIITAGGGLYVGRESANGIGITATAAGNVIAAGFVTAKQYDDAGGSISRFYGVGIHSAGTLVGWGITQLNFIGAGNTFAYNPGTNNVDVSIAGGSGSSGGAVLDITACLFV